MEKNMERTQVYLPGHLKKRLKRYAAHLGVNMSEIIRKEMEKFIAQKEQSDTKDMQAFRQMIREVAGVWKDREDIDFAAIRKSSNRAFKGWNESE